MFVCTFSDHCADYTWELEEEIDNRNYQSCDDKDPRQDDEEDMFTWIQAGGYTDGMVFKPKSEKYWWGKLIVVFIGDASFLLCYPAWSKLLNNSSTPWRIGDNLFYTLPLCTLLGIEFYLYL